MTVFDVFHEVAYTYLQISRGQVVGNVITKETALSGVFKMRENQETTNNIELYQSDATLHVHPEDFADYNALVGNGVRIDGETYEIVRMTVGTNFDTGVVEHLTLTLQRAEFS